MVTALAPAKWEESVGAVGVVHWGYGQLGLWVGYTGGVVSWGCRCGTLGVWSVEAMGGVNSTDQLCVVSSPDPTRAERVW